MASPKYLIENVSPKKTLSTVALHTLAHDLATPITVLKLNMELLKSSLDQQSPALDRMEQGVSQLLDVLELLRSELRGLGC